MVKIHGIGSNSMPEFVFLTQDKNKAEKLKDFLYPDKIITVFGVKEFRELLKGEREYPLYFIDLRLSEKDGINLALEFSFENFYPIILTGELPKEVVSPLVKDLGVYDYICLNELDKKSLREKVNFHLKLKRQERKKPIYKVRLGKGKVSFEIAKIKKETLNLKIKELEENLENRNYLRALQISIFLIKFDDSLLRPKGAIREIVFSDVSDEDLPKQKKIEIKNEDIKKIEKNIRDACFKNELEVALENLKMALLVEDVSLFVKGAKEILINWKEYQFKNEVECIKCGTWNNFGEKYCKRCGADLESSKKIACLSDEDKLAILTGKREKIWEKRFYEKEKSFTSIMGLLFAFLSCFVLPLYISIVAIAFSIINFFKNIKRPAIVGGLIGTVMFILNILGVKTGSVWLEKKILLYHQKYSLIASDYFDSSGIEIEYRVKKPSYVKIWIETVQGRVIRVLVNREVSRGIYKLRWDGKDSSGNFVKYDVFLKMKKGKETYSKVIFYKE